MKLSAQRWISLYKLGIVCAIVGGIGTVVAVPALKSNGVPVPPYFLPFAIATDIYCALFLAWRMRKLKKFYDRGQGKGMNGVGDGDRERYKG